MYAEYQTSDPRHNSRHLECNCLSWNRCRRYKRLHAREDRPLSLRLSVSTQKCMAPGPSRLWNINCNCVENVRCHSVTFLNSLGLSGSAPRSIPGAPPQLTRMVRPDDHDMRSAHHHWPCPSSLSLDADGYASGSRTTDRWDECESDSMRARNSCRAAVSLYQYRDSSKSDRRDHLSGGSVIR